LRLSPSASHLLSPLTGGPELYGSLAFDLCHVLFHSPSFVLSFLVRSIPKLFCLIRLPLLPVLFSQLLLLLPGAPGSFLSPARSGSISPSVSNITSCHPTRSLRLSCGLVQWKLGYLRCSGNAFPRQAQFHGVSRV